MKLDVIRRFTVQALEQCDLLCISIEDMLKMKLEFPKCFREIFEKVKETLRKELTIKFEVIRFTETAKAEQSQDKAAILRSRFASHIMGEILS